MVGTHSQTASAVLGSPSQSDAAWLGKPSPVALNMAGSPYQCASSFCISLLGRSGYGVQPFQEVAA